MLPKTFVPDKDLVLFASPDRGAFAVANVHPLYLSPVACWINETRASVRRAKVATVTVLKAISTLLVFSTLLGHAARLRFAFALGLAEASWSFAVCAALIAGLAFAFASSADRSSGTNPQPSVNPVASTTLAVRVCLFALFFLAYAHTWLYYTRCCVGRETRETPREDLHQSLFWFSCSDQYESSRTRLVAVTVLTFAWINVVGVLKLLRLE